MERMARFEKISFEQFKKDIINLGSVEMRDTMKEDYEAITLPKRSTTGSAGYDFVSPFGFELDAGESILIPTGIKCFIESGWFLCLVPRSSLGFKYRIQIDGTLGIIDSDFYGNESNEGHIFLKLTNDSIDFKCLYIKAGDRIAQGIFLPYGITYDDNATGVRTGGIGSTNEQ